MARARNLKPGFFRNADLAELGAWERLLFAGLWCLCDREGRMEDKPKQIKIDIFPSDAVDVDELLSNIEAKCPDMLRRYEVNGKRYLKVINFKKHQNPHRDEKPSTIPDVDGVVPELVKIEQSVPSTVQTPCLHGAGTVQIGLNPESLNLIPESITPPGEPAPKLSTETVDNPAQGVCLALQNAGIPDASPHDPVLRGWVDKGLAQAVFVDAAAVAVRAGRPSLAYVLGVVKNRVQQAGQVAAVPGAAVVDLQAARPVTVPGRAGPDPELARIERESRQAVRPPDGLFERLRGALAWHGAAAAA